MSYDVKVLIRDCEDNPIKICDVLKASFIQQRTTPYFNAYDALLSIQKDNLEVNKHIRVIKSLLPYFLAQFKPIVIQGNSFGCSLPSSSQFDMKFLKIAIVLNNIDIYSADIVCWTW